MSFINTVFGIPLGYVMYFCYWLLGNYGLAILLFTLLSKILLFPLSLMVQKNSFVMARVGPMLVEIEKKYEGDKKKIAEEQAALYKREGYSTAAGCLPLVVQVPLVLGLLNVVYRPLQHLLHFSSGTIQALVDFTTRQAGASSASQLVVIQMAQADASFFEPLRAVLPDFDAAMAAMMQLDMHFLGLDLSQVPSLFAPGALLLVPLLSCVTTLLSSVVQNRLNQLQKEQGPLLRWGMTIFVTALSTYIAFVVPAGVGLYWIAGNMVSIAVSYICYGIYNPRRYAAKKQQDIFGPGA